MRNKGHVFGVQTFTDSKNTLLGTCPEIEDIGVFSEKRGYDRVRTFTVSEYLG